MTAQPCLCVPTVMQPAFISYGPEANAVALDDEERCVGENSVREEVIIGQGDPVTVEVHEGITDSEVTIASCK